MKSIEQKNFKNKKVIVRVDFNVPLDDNNNVTDNSRIIASFPTVNKLVSDGASIILMSHLGRPKGVIGKLSLKNILGDVEKVFKQKINVYWWF